MVRTNSTMLPLGTALPAFNLELVEGTKDYLSPNLEKEKNLSSNLLGEKPLLIMMICAHCPFVKHIENQLTKLDQDFGESFQIIAISSNSLITHPQDGPDNLAHQSKRNGWRFPYLLDSDQSFAKAIRAACTPDFYIFSSLLNKKQTLLYRGQLDESRPGNEVPVTGLDLRAALESVLEGKLVNPDQRPSIGCNIKWHPGEEPAWFG